MGRFRNYTSIMRRHKIKFKVFNEDAIEITNTGFKNVSVFLVDEEFFGTFIYLKSKDNKVRVRRKQRRDFRDHVTVVHSVDKLIHITRNLKRYFDIKDN